MASLFNSAKKRDYRAFALLASIALVLAFGFVLQGLPIGKTLEVVEEEPVLHPPMQRSSEEALIALVEPEDVIADPLESPLVHQQEAKASESQLRFNQGVAMLHEEEFDHAIKAFLRALELNPYIAEGYTNIGYAYLGKREYDAAASFFMEAIDLNPTLANAHYGIATAFEGQGELEAALGGMRSFLHLTKENDPNQVHVARARSALWEWEAKLGRGPWGPTKGIPPGLNEQQIARDGDGKGKGMGTMVPVADSEHEDGSTNFEVKYSDHIPGQFKQ